MSDQGETQATSPSKPARPPAGRTRSEAIFLGSVVSVSLLAMIALLVMVSRGIFVPAMGIAILAATGVATLVYAFLGGRGDTFSIQGMKLAGAAAVFAVIVYIVDGRLDAQIKALIEKDRQSAEQRGTRTGALLLLDEDMGARPILGGGSVRLREVSTLDGWLEGVPVPEGNSFRATHGNHQRNKERADAAQVLGTIFSRQSVYRPVAEVLSMSQAEWEAFLRDLPENKRNAIGGTPFAVLETRPGDGPPSRTTVFRGDDLIVRNRSGVVEVVVCVERILDTRVRSGEPEVVVLTQHTGSCDFGD